MNTRRTKWAALAVALVASAGCAQLNSLAGSLGQGGGVAGAIPKPSVSVSGVRLERAPSAKDVAGVLCKKVAPAFVCGLLGGGDGNLQFRFAVDLEFKNESNIPIPLVELLAAFTAFPEAQGAQNLGATCISLCEDPASCAQGGATACKADGKDIRSMADFGKAAAGFLFAVATGQEKLENLKIKTVAPKGKTSVTFRLELNPEQILGLVTQLSGSVMDQVKQGKSPSFAIPYKLEGTVWVTIQGLGRIGITLPSFGGAFNIN